MNQSDIRFYQLQLPEKSRESHASKQNKQLGSNQTSLDQAMPQASVQNYIKKK
jgi:hypothetical protein